MTSPSARQRRAETPKKGGPAVPVSGDVELDSLLRDTKEAITSEWDYKIALVVITALAFLTRFWGIGHPNEVVFDEVHFGKVYLIPPCCKALGCGREFWECMCFILTGMTVCFILPTTNIFLRCPSSIWEASFCSHGLVCWIRWALPLR